MKNKKLSRRILSIALLIALLATSYPVATAVEDAAPFEDAIADILTEGDLPLEKLADKELPDEELPEIIDPETARENKNVHRLYKQETDFNSVLFQNSDGSKTMYYFEDAVKYIDYDGNIKDKSNKLYRDKYGLSNADNDIRTYFPDELSETSGVVLNAGNVAIEMVPLPLSSAETSDVLFEEAAIEDTTKKIISTAEQKEDNYVYYNGSFGKGSAIRYTPTYTGVKEDIILESDIGLYDFNFLVSAKGLSAVSDGRRVEFYDDAGNVVAEFAEIVIYDSGEENNITFDSSVSIKETEIPGEYVYTIHAAKDFLQNEETVYPVFIDPVISLPISTTGSGTSKTIIDNPIYSGLPNSCAGSNVYNVVGYAGVAGTGYGVGRTLMKFPGLINNTTFRSISDQQVRSLYLNLYEASGKSTSTTIYANLYTGAAWNETSTTYRNVTWNGYGTQLSSKNFSGGGNTLVQFDLTLTALTWKNNSTIADKGIMLRNSNESSDAYRRDFRSTENSSNKPVIIFSFDTSIPVTSVTVLPASATVTVNSSLTLTASVIPSNATNRNIVWSSSNTGIAIVNSTSGVVTGVNPGTVTITATSLADSTKKGTCTVTVNPATYTVMSLGSTYSGTISAGRHYWYTFTPSETGTYVFESTGSMDTYGILYHGSSQINYNDDDGENLNFKIIHRLFSGTQYRLMVRGYSTTHTGSFSVMVNKGWPKEDKPTIYPRNSWGARPLDTTRRVHRTREPQRIIFHHSADKFSSTDFSTIANEIKRIQNLHMDNEGKSDIAYHFIIDPAGGIWVGAELDDYQRGHATGYFDDIGVVLLGDFEPRFVNPFPNILNQDQKDAMETLSKWLCYSNDLSIVASGQNVAPISTHRTVNPGTTVCPGENAAPWIEGDLRTTINNWRS